MHPDELRARLLALDPDLPAGRALRFFEDVLDLNQRHNVVSRREPAATVASMILEGFLAARAIPFEAGERILDIGTGAGFPGIPVALARPLSSVSLLDRRPVACAFLRHQVLGLGLQNASVHEGQAKEILAGRGLAAHYQWVLLKAVAPPRDALRLACPFLRPGGRVALFRSEGWVPDEVLSDGGWKVLTALPLEDGSSPGERPAVFVFAPISEDS